MVEMFEGQCVDWSKFNAKDAIEYTKRSQELIQEKEYIDIVKEIAYVATLGHSKLTLSKKLSDYIVSRLKANGFNVIVGQNLCNTVITGGASIKSDYWATTIEW